jgi:hypothetical protein
MPLAPLESPFRAFSLPRSRAWLSPGPCFLAGSRTTAAWRDVPECFHDRFPRPADPLPRLALAGSPDAGAGKDGSLRPLRRSAVHAAKRADSDRLARARRARPLAAGTPASKPCSPRKVRSRVDRYPGRGNDQRAGALLGFIPSRALSSDTPGSVLRRGARRTGRSREASVSRSSWPRQFSRGPFSDPGLMPPGTAGVRGRSAAFATVRQRPEARMRMPPHALAGRQPRPLRRGVLPTPPLGGVPRLPYPSPPAPG